MSEEFSKHLESCNEEELEAVEERIRISDDFNMTYEEFYRKNIDSCNKKAEEMRISRELRNKILIDGQSLTGEDILKMDYDKIQGMKFIFETNYKDKIRRSTRQRLRNPFLADKSFAYKCWLYAFAIAGNIIYAFGLISLYSKIGLFLLGLFFPPFGFIAGLIETFYYLKGLL